MDTNTSLNTTTGLNTTTRRPDHDDKSWTPSLAAGLQRGTVLGRYTVLEAIGSGGMGNVFAAWDPELRRRVAIKILHGELMRSAAKERAQQRLRREAQAAARLAHPNVVAVYDVGTFEAYSFVAMELVEGQTLRAWSATPRPWREVLEIYRQAGQGLAAAHQAGLVHRDFKPGNVMLADDGQVKILDFGLAKANDINRADGSPPSAENLPAAVATAETTTMSGQLMGTPRYMSPEQLRGQPVDHRSDQFSFCVALYRALYRCSPFPGETDVELQLNLPSARLREAPQDRDVPPWLHQVLARGLKVDPRQRYPSMHALLADLAIDPNVRRRNWGVAAVLVALTAAAFFGLRPQAVACEESGQHLDDVWNPARRSVLEQAFLGLDVQGAPARWRQVTGGLDSKVLQLRSMYTEVCEATHVRGEQSMQLLDRRMACLDDRRRTIGALINLFAQGRPEILANAARAVSGLPNTAACADRQALADLAPPPAGATAAAVATIRDRVAEVLALELAGKYREALEPITAALADATQTGYQPLIGEVQLQQAKIIGRLGDSEGMRDLLIDAASIALATHHRELLAQAYLQLIVVGFLRGEGDHARSFGSLAQGAISTLSGRQDLEAQRLFFLGMISIREGRFNDAARQYEQYLTIKEEISPLEHLTALNNYAHALREQGELERARAVLRRSEPLLDELAPGHDAHFTLLASMGQLSLAFGEHAEAEAYFLRSLEGFQETVGPEHPKVGNILTMLGNVYMATDQLSKAIEVLEAATAIYRHAPRYNDRPVERRWLLGQALWEQGSDRQRALQLIREAAADADAPGQEEAAAAATAWLRRQEGN